MHNLILLLTLAGSTGLFLYGMKLLSESLQKIMGERIRVVLSSMNSNNIKNVFTGMFISGLVLSSSATTVMVVSFVNAGILRLVEAVSIIMGANIGTTIVAWMISIFGYQINFTYLALPLIGISLPFIFSNNRKIKNWGEIVLGFSLLFISLNFIKQQIPLVFDNWLSELIANITNLGYISYVIFLFFGILITLFIRSSSAIYALTLVLSVNGWISFELAAAMVLGENIGASITPIIASRDANVNAKRTALAHFLFNVIGVVWIMSIFPFFLKSLSGFYSLFSGGKSPLNDPSQIPLALAIVHTSFNVLNTMLLIGFSSQITNMVVKRFPVNTSDNEFKLTHIKIGLLSTPEASLFQARRETIVFAENVRKMFMRVERLFVEKDEKEYQLLKEKVLSANNFADRMEREIANYLTKVGQGRLSESSSSRLRALYKIIDEIESVADSCMNILNAVERKRTQKIEFPEQTNNNINLIFNMVQESLDLMVTMLTYENEVPLSSAQETEREINNFRDILKSEHLDNLEKGIYNYNAGIIYNDIISQCERIGDFTINVDQTFKNVFN